jgi:hypothetical protein
MTNYKDWEAWLLEIEMNGVNLTTWEEDFIESLSSQIDIQVIRDSQWTPSDKQLEILERIYTDRTP